jgi:pyruvate/2-oxoglutarate/acetoin dehydrogenase E1 component
MSGRTMSYAQSLRQALIEEMERDHRIIVMGEDVGVYGGVFTVTRTLLQRFGPERVRDTPISEAALAGMAVGMAMMGLRPVVEIMYEDFTTIALDQLVNNAAKMRYMSSGKINMPLVLRTQGGSGRGSAAQHSQSLEAWFAHVPGLVVVMPSTPNDAKGLLKSAIRDDNPVVFLEHKMLYFSRGPIHTEECLPIGRADIKRPGDDLTVVATSWMVPRVLAAADTVAADGISVEVVDPRTLRPLDEQTLVESVRKTGRALIIHEAPKFAGIGAEIAALINDNCFQDLDQPVKRLAGVEAPIPYSKSLEDIAVPTQQLIEDTMRTMVGS